MKLKAFFLALSLVLASMISIATFAHGQTIDFEFQNENRDPVNTVAPGDSFYVVITVDPAIGVAGCALTVKYDKDNFEVEETNEGGNYFVALSGMFVCVYDDRDPNDPKQAVPSIGNKETLGEVLLSGAYVNPDETTEGAGGGAYTGKQELFAVRFKVIEYAHTAPSSHTFTVKQTEILNADAGWGTDGTAEAIPVLVGAVPKSDKENWDDLAGGAFPVLLGDLTALTHDITVSESGPLATLTVSPDTATVTVGDTQQFTVEGRDADGNVVTEIGTITWSVDGGIGSIIESGVFTATAEGTGSVTATSDIDDISDTSGNITVSEGGPGPLATLTVSPDTATVTVGATQQFTVEGKDADGNVVTEIGTITWSVDGGIGSIIESGVFTATAEGTGSVTATSDIDDISDTSGNITVSEGGPGPLATLTVSPDTATVTVGATQQFTVEGKDADGNVVTEIGTITWSVDGGIGSIIESGVFTATAQSTGSVTATSDIDDISDTSGNITVANDGGSGGDDGGGGSCFIGTAFGSGFESHGQMNGLLVVLLIGLVAGGCMTLRRPKTRRAG